MTAMVQAPVAEIAGTLGAQIPAHVNGCDRPVEDDRHRNSPMPGIRGRRNLKYVIPTTSLDST
jgi:hypothetical protein